MAMEEYLQKQWLDLLPAPPRTIEWRFIGGLHQLTDGAPEMKSASTRATFGADVFSLTCLARLFDQISCVETRSKYFGKVTQHVAFNALLLQLIVAVARGKAK